MKKSRPIVLIVGIELEAWTPNIVGLNAKHASMIFEHENPDLGYDEPYY